MIMIATHNNCLAKYNSDVDYQITRSIIKQNLFTALNGARLIEEKVFLGVNFFPIFF